MKKIKTGIYGAAGYTGLELAKLLHNHPHTDLVFGTSENQAGRSLQASHAQAPDLLLQSAKEVNPADVDTVFLCLPHTKSAEYAAQADAAGTKVIDLSADLRLDSAAAYEHWYGTSHPAPHLLPVPYGLPELSRDKLYGADVIANPGCYATAITLALAPLLRANLVDAQAAIIIDAKSGTTGAGRTPKTNILFSEVQGNLSPYNIGQTHRHIGEVEQFLDSDGLNPGQLIFSPHLLPTDRGILSAAYVPINEMSTAVAAIEAQYAAEPLVHVLPQGELATLAHVVRTPKAVISLTPTGNNTLIVMVAIDNLLKGAASQAIQNFNLMHQIPETLGLLSSTAVLA